MMTVLLLKHVIMIDNKLKNQNTVDKKQQPGGLLFLRAANGKSLPLHRANRACKESSSYSEASGKTCSGETGSAGGASAAKPGSGETGSASEVSGRKNGSCSKAGSCQHNTGSIRGRGYGKSRLLSKRHRKHRPDPKQFSVQSVAPRLDVHGKCPNCGK